MEFEFDPAKSLANQKKHGIDFKAAQTIWHDDCRLEIPARVQGEPRHLVIGRIGNNYWSAIITYRRATIRLISVRRARKEERELYENI